MKISLSPSLFSHQDPPHPQPKPLFSSYSIGIRIPWQHLSHWSLDDDSFFSLESIIIFWERMESSSFHRIKWRVSFFFSPFCLNSSLCTVLTHRHDDRTLSSSHHHSFCSSADDDSISFSKSFILRWITDHAIIIMISSIDGWDDGIHDHRHDHSHHRHFSHSLIFSIGQKRSERIWSFFSLILRFISFSLSFILSVSPLLLHERTWRWRRRWWKQNTSFIETDINTVKRIFSIWPDHDDPEKDLDHHPLSKGEKKPQKSWLNNTLMARDRTDSWERTARTAGFNHHDGGLRKKKGNSFIIVIFLLVLIVSSCRCICRSIPLHSRSSCERRKNSSFLCFTLSNRVEMIQTMFGNESEMWKGGADGVMRMIIIPGYENERSDEGPDGVKQSDWIELLCLKNSHLHFILSLSRWLNNIDESSSFPSLKWKSPEDVFIFQVESFQTTTYDQTDSRMRWRDEDSSWKIPSLQNRPNPSLLHFTPRFHLGFDTSFPFIKSSEAALSSTWSSSSWWYSLFSDIMIRVRLTGVSWFNIRQ